MTQLPAPLWNKIKMFLDAHSTGQIVLDVKEGRVLAYKIIQCGRVENIDDDVAIRTASMLGSR